eukprot:CAMPEP_0115315148 /NCGR_PEP_ID=MMETSP0270-20121206/77421_1 /TAXON_ID=71861 /ORGANISM="Scrippsiella trochoidea, Strain CCMP3099" /LENGTH=62 /DNA_ID=CAMNT_0002734441 /DNA_START=15 /DNA_END=200 /DNA_ORIENTATION=-
MTEIERKQFMIDHMNEDHADSLLAYVVHYTKLSSADSALLTDMSWAGMTLEVSHRSNLIKLM